MVYSIYAILTDMIFMRPLSRLLCSLFFCLLWHPGYASLKNLEQELSDTMITTKISTRYAQHKNLSLLKLVVSTHDGVVKLSGHVNDNQAFVDALRIANNTKGVKFIDTDDLEIKPVNNQLTDVYITTKVEAAILTAKVLDDESIPLVGINASTHNGIVTLTGSVKRPHAMDAILKRAHGVHGVKKIISKLTLLPTPPNT